MDKLIPYIAYMLLKRLTVHYARVSASIKSFCTKTGFFKECFTNIIPTKAISPLCILLSYLPQYHYGGEETERQ
jgi:hypothetical protein